MPEDITKGELVRVIDARRVHNPHCQVLAIEYNTEHHKRFAPVWYLLDTRWYGSFSSMPRWFERHEIEPVMPENRGVV